MERAADPVQSSRVSSGFARSLSQSRSAPSMVNATRPIGMYPLMPSTTIRFRHCPRLRWPAFPLERATPLPPSMRARRHFRPHVRAQPHRSRVDSGRPGAKLVLSVPQAARNERVRRIPHATLRAPSIRFTGMRRDAQSCRRQRAEKSSRTIPKRLTLLRAPGRRRHRRRGAWAVARYAESRNRTMSITLRSQCQSRKRLHRTLSGTSRRPNRRLARPDPATKRLPRGRASRRFP